MQRLIGLTLGWLAVGLAPAVAQGPEPDRWQIQTEQGDYLWDIRILRLEGGALVYRQADSLAQIPVERIKELRLIRKTTLRLADSRGDAGAATYAALTGADDEVHDFAPLDFAARMRAIRQILLAHPPAPE
jgi:hypothetical protein